MKLPDGLVQPPREFSVMPFWFWNDALDEDEIVRQIRDFEAHGVYGFIIHPRVGLPRDLGWMSERLLGFYRVAIEEARRRAMYVVLYDEGMYPSGSSSGQVVATDQRFACRCLARMDLEGGREPALSEGENLVAVVRRRDGTRMAAVDRKVDSVIRGLHYVGEGPAEDEPPAADLLNPEAVATFVRLVYEPFAAHFSAHFGKTVFAIFTDEPGLLGRCRERDVVPGTTGILEHVNRLLGYDFTPHLPALWHDDEPDAQRFRRDYHRAVHERLEETYYCQLSAWCREHGIALTGHPGKGDDIGALRHFDIPGQDLVWRWVLPDHPTALEGAESTQGKCSSSAMIHGGQRRNANECCGAYGHELTWEEMVWLARWCFARGVNLLFPHAFYYSVRGPRRDERPPDVGPNSPWWGRYREYADACRRLSWLNADSVHVCELAILGTSDWLPWRAAKACHRHQRDFNYLTECDLAERAVVDPEGIHIAGMTYRALIVEHEPSPAATAVLEGLAGWGRVVRYAEGMSEGSLIDQVDRLVPTDVRVSPPAPALRVRHVRKAGFHCYLVFNEEKAPLEVAIQFPIAGTRFVFDAAGGGVCEAPPAGPIRMEGHELKVIMIAERRAAEASGGHRDGASRDRPARGPRA